MKSKFQIVFTIVLLSLLTLNTEARSTRTCAEVENAIDNVDGDISAHQSQIAYFKQKRPFTESDVEQVRSSFQQIQVLSSTKAQLFEILIAGDCK